MSDYYELGSYVTAKLSNNAQLLVEVTPVGGVNAEQDVVSGNRIFSLTPIAEAIRGVAEVMIDALETVRPRKASVEFGIEAGIDSGNLTAMLVKGSTKANLKITLEWVSSVPQPLDAAVKKPAETV
jgi:hypothetical protein